ncbi:hypothetical protein Mapa_001337 [Marchantia paleacea]|nr:hypothetical protein Mapa_001337 [Marchantia paleacea]
MDGERRVMEFPDKSKVKRLDKFPITGASVIRLLVASRITRLASLPIDTGKLDIRLLLRVNLVNPERLPMDSGRPVILLETSLGHCRLGKFPTHAGSTPVRLLSLKSRSVSLGLGTLGLFEKRGSSNCKPEVDRSRICKCSIYQMQEGMYLCITSEWLPCRCTSSRLTNLQTLGDSVPFPRLHFSSVTAPVDVLHMIPSHWQQSIPALHDEKLKSLHSPRIPSFISRSALVSASEQI